MIKSIIKYLTNITLLFIFIANTKSASAQANFKRVKDTVYYLLDTANTPATERMWKTSSELSYKQYTILCPCLAYNTQPVFIHKLDDKGATLNKNINLVKLTTLPDLLAKAKKVTDDNTDYFIFYIIENIKHKYTVHKVSLVQPVRHETTNN